MTIGDFAQKRGYLFWYVKDKKKLSPEAIVEGVLNYGDWDDIQQLIKILGVKKTATIFRMEAGRARTNYRERTKNYFSLYFNKHA